MKGVNFLYILIGLFMCHSEMYAQECQLYELAIDQSLTSVYFVDAQNGWLVGVNGTIFRTRDAGANWYSQSSGTNLQLNDVYFSNTNDGFVVGNNGLILSTSDAGETWMPVESESQDCLFAIDSYDNQTFWIVGASGTVLQSEDRGGYWQNLEIAETKGNLYDLTSTLSGEMIAVGESNQLISLNNSESRIVRQAFGNSTATNTSVTINDNQLFVSSSEGLRKKEMEAANKSQAVLLQSGFIRKTVLHPNGRAILVGNQGQLQSLTQNGEWQTVDCGTAMGLNDVTFSEADRAWAVGNQGTLLRIDFDNSNLAKTFISNISPNPSSGIFELTTTAEDYSIKIFDDKGTLIREFPVSQQSRQMIDLSSQTSGMYMVQIQSKDYQKAMKVVLINE